MTPRKLCAAGSLLCAALGTVAAPAGAQESNLGFEFNAGVGYSDNVNRNVDAFAESTNWLEAGIVGSGAWRTPRIEFTASTDVAYRQYSRDQSSDEVVGGANATLGLEVVPKYLRWIVEDTYTQTALDPTAPDAPENRQATNSLSTGPDLFVPLGARTRAFAKARWQEVSYGDQELDTTRKTGVVGVERKVTAMTTVRVQATETRAEYDDPTLNPDAKGREYSAVLLREAPRSTAEVELGRTRIEFRGNSDSALLARGRLSLELSPRSSLTISARREYADGGEFIGVQQVGSNYSSPVGPGVQAGDPLERKSADVRWSREGARFSTQLAVTTERDRRQENTQLNVNRTGVEGNLSTRIGPRLTAGLLARQRRDRYPELGFTNDESWYGLTLGWAVGRRLTLSATLDRLSGEYGGSSTKYVENRVFLALAYGRGR